LLSHIDGCIKWNEMYEWTNKMLGYSINSLQDLLERHI
jgi:hypothetical protein